jgi:hypothetical protein
MAMWPLLRLFELLKARGLLASLTSGTATRDKPEQEIPRPSRIAKKERSAIRLSVPHGRARRMRQISKRTSPFLTNAPSG